MSTQDISTQPTSLVRRRLAVAMIVVGVGAILPAFTSADENFTCPVGTETDGLVYNYPDPVDEVFVGNWPALWVGVGLTDGTHVLYGNGVDFMNNQTLFVFADTGLQATDAHLCKESDTPPPTTAPPTETTAPPTETTAPPTETTAPPTETTAPPTETTAPPTSVDQGAGTTTTTLVGQEGATTTTIVTELPRTGSGVSNLTAFGGLLILLGGLMLHSTRRIEALD